MKRIKMLQEKLRFKLKNFDLLLAFDFINFAFFSDAAEADIEYKVLKRFVCGNKRKILRGHSSV